MTPSTGRPTSAAARRVALVQAGNVPVRRRRPVRAGAADPSGIAGSATRRSDAETRLLQALNCLLIETPAGRVLVETGIGERIDDKGRAMRGYEGPWIVAALKDAGFDPGSIDVVAMSHLHFDHAGGLLAADGSRAFPRARIVAQRAEWDIALGGNPRLVASYVQPELAVVLRDWGVEGWVDGEREILPGVSGCPDRRSFRPDQAIVVRAPGAAPLAFFGDLAMRPWSANPRW